MKTTLVTTGIVAALLLGVVNFGKPVQVSVSPTPVQVNVPEGKAPIVNVEAPEVRIPATVVNVPKQDAPTLGAVSGPDFFFDYFNLNGVKTYATSKSLAQATTTVCSIRSPIGATSTLAFGAIRFNIASTSATYLEIAKATTAFATTTRIGSTYNFAASAQATIVASTTGSVAGDGTIFAPGEYLNIKTSWSVPAGVGSVPTGVCKATFVAI